MTIYLENVKRAKVEKPWLLLIQQVRTVCLFWVRTILGPVKSLTKSCLHRAYTVVGYTINVICSRSIFGKTNKQDASYKHNHFESQRGSKLQKLKYQTATDEHSLFRQIKSCSQGITTYLGFIFLCLFWQRGESNLKFYP